ncbi:MULTISPECIES: hypothetical protein [Protofrankia]|uniref:LPXTG-motif cell wall anchor domain protein n=1 Tax=Candidatus Protofrankia datiscae TaxID=2716812 RepID=F8B6F1_9ACTN|nr:MULTISPECIES: hypothetical protein [Protofrankia]AEH09247.1 hypothetical protein FsymDg_1800 [Candidatus Protofrankia datiscae]
MTHKIGRGVVMLAMSAVTGLFVGFGPTAAFADGPSDSGASTISPAATQQQNGGQSWSGDGANGWPQLPIQLPTPQPPEQGENGQSAQSGGGGWSGANPSQSSGGSGSQGAAPGGGQWPGQSGQQQGQQGGQQGQQGGQQGQPSGQGPGQSATQKPSSEPVPQGGVHAGGGGMAPSFPIAPIAGAGLGVAVLGAGLAARRRSHATR